MMAASLREPGEMQRSRLRELLVNFLFLTYPLHPTPCFCEDTLAVKSGEADEQMQQVQRIRVKRRRWRPGAIYVKTTSLPSTICGVAAVSMFA